MDCPVCHTENRAEASKCAACGRSLNSSSRRANSRRKIQEASEAAAFDSYNPAAWRAYRVALWSLLPGVGMLLAPVAIVLGVVAARGAADDLSARNRSKAAVLLGVLITLTQWLGVTLMIFGWR